MSDQEKSMTKKELEDLVIQQASKIDNLELRISKLEKQTQIEGKGIERIECKHQLSKLR